MNYKYTLKLLEKQRTCQRKLMSIKIEITVTLLSLRKRKYRERIEGKIKGGKIRRKTRGRKTG